MKKSMIFMGVILALMAGVVFYGAFFVVYEPEYALVLRFGKIKQDRREPGLYLKAPFVDNVVRVEKRQQEWDGEPNQIPTSDKKYIFLDTTARWRIVDPVRFFTSVRNETGAQTRLDDLLDGAARDAVSAHRLDEVVRDLDYYQNVASHEREQLGETVGRSRIVAIIEAVGRKEVQQYGIELTDFRIKRINYVPEVQAKVYERMKAERQKVSAQYKSEGEAKAAEIRGQMRKALKEIQSEAYRKSIEIRGKADADATRIYAEAYSQDPEFYQYLKTLEGYEKTIKENTRLVIQANSEFYKYLKSSSTAK